MTTAVDAALTLLPLHLERAVRDNFGLAPNPKLEDVMAGDLDDALRALRDKKEVQELFEDFVA